MRKVRYQRIHWLFRRFNETGRSLSHVYVTRNTFCTSKSHLYSKSLPMSKKGWSESGKTRGFAKPQSLSHSFNRDVMSSKSRAKNRKYTKEEEEPDTDAETEDEGDMESETLKSNRKFKSQKSGKIILRPSRYSFKHVRLSEEEENRWERRHGTEDKKGKTNWYARQMLRLTQEDKVGNVLIHNYIHCTVRKIQKVSLHYIASCVW